MDIDVGLETTGKRVKHLVRPLKLQEVLGTSWARKRYRKFLNNK